jgi:ppGpp synthetase/RelA/SpoT-type nucleotidyltranferase
MQVLLESCGLPFQVDFEAREEGYYAAHVYTQYPCQIPKEDWDVEKVEAIVEIQITTQLQEVIRRLLHKYYEARRGGAKEVGVKWQWDYDSDEFAANYLGHILHYVEGMIVDIRERQKEPTL